MLGGLSHACALVLMRQFEPVWPDHRQRASPSPLSADGQILSHTLVLTNGTVVEVTPTSNPDLAFLLRGGLNNVRGDAYDSKLIA